MHFHRYVWIQEWQGVVKAWNVELCSKCHKVRQRINVLDIYAGTYKPGVW